MKLKSENWTTTMASIASSSSTLSTCLLLHSPTPQLGRRRMRPNFVRIMPTRSCLDDTSSLLTAAQYTVCIIFQFIIVSFLSSFQTLFLFFGCVICNLCKQFNQSLTFESPFWCFTIIQFIGRWMSFVEMYYCCIGGYIREKWHGCRFGVWSCFWYGHSAFGPPASSW